MRHVVLAAAIALLPTLALAAPPQQQPSASPQQPTAADQAMEAWNNVGGMNRATQAVFAQMQEKLVALIKEDEALTKQVADLKAENAKLKAKKPDSGSP